jgi:hypothetical protein
MKKISTLFFFIAALSLLAAPHLWAEDLSLQLNGHTLKGADLSAALELTGDVSYDTIDAIRNGITAKFFITFQISSSSRFMGRSKTTFTEKVEAFNISYDVWENTYVLRDTKRKNARIAHNSGDIVKEINDAINPLAVNVGAFDRVDRLYLRGKIKIQTIRLFPPFGIFLLFFDPWNFESDWIPIDLKYEGNL